MRLGAQPTRLEPGTHRRQLLRHDGNLRAAPPSLRVQQRLPPAVRRPRHAVLRHQPRRLAGRNHRAARASVVPGRAVPPRVQVEADRRRTRCSPASSARPSPTATAKRAAARSAVESRRTAHAIPRRAPAAQVRIGHGRRKEDHHRRRLEVAGRRPRRKRPRSSRADRRKPAAAAQPATLQMPPASLEMLVTTLVTEAMISLGQIPHPHTGEVDLPARSRRSI